MTVLLMDDTRKRRGQIGELLLKKHAVTECFTSNDFIEQLETTTPDLLLLDADTWRKGAAIYNYFRIGKQLEKMPVVLYNADEETSYLPDRTRHDEDRILPKPFAIESLVESVLKDY